MYMNQAVTVVFCADDVWNGVGNQGLLHPCKKLQRKSLSQNRVVQSTTAKKTGRKMVVTPYDMPLRHVKTT